MKAWRCHLPYLPPRSLREEPRPRRRPKWKCRRSGSSSFISPSCTTDDGRTVEIIQPGFWNHGGGPDFTRAVVRFRCQRRAAPEMQSPSATSRFTCAHDWNAHGHHADAAYNETILHVVWEPERGQAVLSGHGLVSPRAASRAQVATHRAVGRTAAALCIAAAASPARRGAGTLLAGTRAPSLGSDRRHPAGGGAFSPAPEGAALVLAGEHLTQPEQALFEALAEALGFHANQIPMRLVAQRLPWKMLRALGTGSALGPALRPGWLSARAKASAIAVGAARVAA